MADPELERERRVIALFEAAVALPEDQRAAAVADGADDAVMAERVRALLEADKRAALRTGAALDGLETEAMPERIGAYRIEELLGRGGMGSVYRGTRASGDFDHVVAIKVIKPGLFSQSLAGRFRHERQLLAGLSHPHIARLYDGGETANGSPYLIMEFVDGLPLLQWATEQEATLGERTSVFLDICDAVAFAHRNLIVHRDLTPSNVLVSRDGVAKLIDFGIARPADDPDAVREASSLASLSLTPGYAAPERMTSAAVTTSADIYSLGKIFERLMPVRNDADLAAISARAAATDPAARYPTVEALADDLVAWRNSAPVSARQGGRRYVAGKFLRRHSGAVAAGVATLLLLAGALAYALIANSRAQAARADAEARFGQVRSLAGYMLFDLNGALARVPGNTAARAELADRAQGYLASLAGSPGAAPALQLETARGLIRLAEIQGVPNRPNLGQRPKAVSNLDRAERLLGSLGALAGADTLRGLASIDRGLIALHGATDQAAARAAFDRADRLLSGQAEASRTPEWYDARRALLTARLDYADSAGERARIGDLLAAAERERAGWPAARKGGLAARIEAAQAAYYRGLLDAETGKPSALFHHLEGERAFDALLRERPDDPLLLYRATWNGVDGFVVASQSGDEVVSDRLIRRAAATIDRVAAIDPNDDAVRALQANTKEAMAQNLRDADQFAEAIRVQMEVVALRRIVLASPPTGKQLGNLGFSQMILGIIERDSGNRAFACRSWAEALASLRAARKTGQIIGFHEGFIPGLEKHVNACEAGGKIDTPMR